MTKCYKFCNIMISYFSKNYLTVYKYGVHLGSCYAGRRVRFGPIGHPKKIWDSLLSLTQKMGSNYTVALNLDFTVFF